MNVNIFKSATSLIVTLLVLSACSTREIYQSTWVSKNQEKLEANDLTKKIKSDKKSKIAYLVSNNEDAIFVDLYIQNEMIQRKMVLFGTTTWFDFEGKSRKKLGIKYPLKNESFNQGYNRNSRNKPKQGLLEIGNASFANQAERMLNNFIEIELIDEKNDRGRIIDLRVQNDLGANIEFEKTGLMIYRLKVPYKTLGISVSDLENKKIAIGIETGHLNSEKVMQQMRSQGHKQGGRMQGGGKRSGGMSAGRSPGMSPETQALQKTTSFWIKNIQLTQTNSASNNL